MALFYDDDTCLTRSERLPKEVNLFDDADEIEEGFKTPYDQAAEMEGDWRRLEINSLCELFHV